MERRVAKVTPSTKIRDRYYIDLDSGESLTITINQIADHSIYTGRVLSEEEYSALKADADNAMARNTALKMLGARPMSKKELADKLSRKGTDESAANSAVEWLENIGAVNDSEYAVMIVRHYAAKGYGIGRVRDELYRRGVPKELWDEALENMPETEDTVYRLLLQKLKSTDPDKNEISKAANALYRRGFSWDEIKAALNKFEAEERQ